MVDPMGPTTRAPADARSLYRTDARSLHCTGARLPYRTGCGQVADVTYRVRCVWSVLQVSVYLLERVFEL